MLALALAATVAGTACVEVQRPECGASFPTLAAALDGGAAVVQVGPGRHAGDAASPRSVEIAGVEGTVLTGSLTLTGAAVTVRGARVEGRLELGAGTAALNDLDLASVRVDGGTVTGRHLTIMDGLTVDGGSVQLTSSATVGPGPFVARGGGTVRTRYSAHAPDADAEATDRVDPPADPRHLAGSVLVDAGDPAPLAPFEPFEDAAGLARIADGDGDGVLRRDIGAYEAQVPATPAPPDSVLVNGGAEDGFAGWSGTFVIEDYGEAFLPSRPAAAALAGGARFFSAAAAESATLFQRIDVAAAATAIDRGTGRAALSGLVGGYGADPDTLSVEAVFKDPEGAPLGRLELAPVTAADRANGTNLLARTASGAIPARTRAIDVLLRGRRTAGAYTDAFADNLGLVLSVPGVPIQPPVDPEDPPVDDLEPFDGIAVLTAQPRFTRGGVAPVLLACADATVGACRGTVALRGRLPGARRVARIGRATGFAVRPGAARAVSIRLLDEARERLAARGAHPATLVTESYDGQGLRRAATVPVTLTFPARRS